MATKQQYVNLDPTKPEQLKEIPKARAGRRLTLVATVNKKRSGVTVMFELKSGAGNQVPDLHPGNFTAKQIAKLPGLGCPAKVERRAVTNNKGKAEITFILSEYGGDEFDVRAWIPGKGGKQLFSDKYVVWKRFYYQVSRFNAGAQHLSRGGAVLPAIPALGLDPVLAEFAARNHNIEIVKDPAPDLITRRGEISDIAACTAAAAEGYTRTREPVSMRVVHVRQIADSATVQRTFEDFTEGVMKQIDLGAAPWIDESLPQNTDWLVTAEWAWTSGDMFGSWKPLAGVNHFVVAGGRLVNVTFPAMPARMVYSNRNLRLRLTYRYLSGSTNGMQWYNSVWLASENMSLGARTVPAKEQTAIHEIGHFIGMADAAQSTHYVHHGHQGPHCSTGLSVTDKALTSYRGLNGTCVMFGENAATRTGVFCAVCDPSVCGADIHIPTMPLAW
jgi:hypothetical protein